MFPNLLGRFPPKQHSQDLFLLPAPWRPSFSLKAGVRGMKRRCLCPFAGGDGWSQAGLSKNLAIEQKPGLGQDFGCPCLLPSACKWRKRKTF